MKLFDFAIKFLLVMMLIVGVQAIVLGNNTSTKNTIAKKKYKKTKQLSKCNLVGKAKVKAYYNEQTYKWLSGTWFNNTGHQQKNADKYKIFVN